MNCYGNSDQLSAINSTEEDEFSESRPRLKDENVNENDRNMIIGLVEEFPDPYDFVIGFSCVSNLDTRRESSSSHHRGSVAYNSKTAKSPSIESSARRPKTSENMYN